jgi:hypothetical protein
VFGYRDHSTQVGSHDTGMPPNGVDTCRHAGGVAQLLVQAMEQQLASLVGIIHPSKDPPPVFS